MLRASFSEVIGGRSVAFAMPLSALSRVAEREPRLFRLHERLSSRDVTLSDVEAVLSAASDADAARHVIETLGFVGAMERAQKILILALTDPAPEGDDAGKRTAAAGETPDLTPPSTGAHT